MTSYTHNKTPPHRSGETGKNIGFSKILLNITSLKHYNCGSFRNRAASAWPERKLKLGGSLLGEKENVFSHGNTQPFPSLGDQAIVLGPSVSLRITQSTSTSHELEIKHT